MNFLTPFSRAFICFSSVYYLHSHSFYLPLLTLPAPWLLGRDEWAALRQELLKEPSNGVSLEDIDSALVVVCLEEDDFTRDQAAEFSHMMLHGNGMNRYACVVVMSSSR